MSSLVGKWTFREILLGSLHTCHRPSVWAIVRLEQRVWKKLFLASEARQRCQHKLAWASSLHWDFPIKVKKYLHPSTSLDPQEAYISPTCLSFTFLVPLTPGHQSLALITIVTSAGQPAKSLPFLWVLLRQTCYPWAVFARDLKAWNKYQRSQKRQWHNLEMLVKAVLMKLCYKTTP